METQRPLAIKVISLVAALLLPFTILSLGGALKVALGHGSFLAVTTLIDKMADTLLWLGLLVTAWRQSRLAVLMALALLGKTCLSLYLHRDVFASQSSDFLIETAAMLSLANLLVTAALLESTVRLWRRGLLR